jgi:hypothetical protein
MMRHGSVIRDLALVCIAVAIGWWLRGAGTPVQASSSSGSTPLAFQMTGTGPDALLTLYNVDNRTLYVYPRIGAGSSSINCAYSFRVASPGAPLQRDNCPLGELAPQR